MSRIIRQGTAPTMGPKKGMILVTPTMTLTRMAKGILIRQDKKKHSIPMMALSMIFPLRKAEKI